jgi:hypothetical protein
VYNANDVRHTAEPLVEIAIAKFKKYKSPGNDQIPAELITAGREALLFAINELNSIWNRE